MRVLLLKLALVLLPFVLYGAYLAISHVRGKPPENRTPMLVLTAVGVGLLAFFVFAIGPLTGGDPGDKYVPTRVEDGKVIRGHFEDADAPEPDADDSESVPDERSLHR